LISINDDYLALLHSTQAKPTAHSMLNWSLGHLFLDTELRPVQKVTELGKQIADLLVQVTLYGSAEQWVYIHVEVQGQQDPKFAQ
jgi:hypothetical protein